MTDGLDKQHQIPKIIHYVWVGGKPLTPLAEHCLASWKKYLPDYEIKRWDESNSSMNHPYVKVMYAKKKWAFVSDYIRFWVLAEHGGVYLDTDQEIFKSLNPLLNQTGFVGRSKSGQIESSVIGAVPAATFVKKALHFYNTDKNFLTADTSPLVLERAIKEAGSIGVSIYDSSFFHPINEGENLTPAARAQAYGIHHWAESWVPLASWRKLARRLGLMRFVKRMYGFFR